MQVSDASGTVEMTEVASGESMSRALVTSDDVFIVDDGIDVMVWIGKGASRTERKKVRSHEFCHLRNTNITNCLSVRHCSCVLSC
jgi:hypothetical protein